MGTGEGEPERQYCIDELRGLNEVRVCVSYRSVALLFGTTPRTKPPRAHVLEPTRTFPQFFPSASWDDISVYVRHPRDSSANKYPLSHSTPRYGGLLVLGHVSLRIAVLPLEMQNAKVVGENTHKLKFCRRRTLFGLHVDAGFSSSFSGSIIAPFYPMLQYQSAQPVVCIRNARPRVP